ncbi:MAG: Phosphate regulon transcriptional regulatory protein PhoB [Phycisphaerae bacterium]|nr:Phosphate regulon transcriptional regulatory protein PhoB [Phycisphaerae bacterium]
MKSKTILVIDDEKDLVELIEFNLHREGYRTLTAYDGVTGTTLAQQHMPDLVLLDLMLPKRSGQEVAVMLKSNETTKRIPIIMLTAKSEESDIVVGLTLGADDYVAKPFSIKVLLARIEAVMRRAAQTAPLPDVLNIGELQIDRSRHRVLMEGVQVALTLTEFRLLDSLTAANGRVLSREQLMNQALGNDAVVTDRTIDVHITSLRKKLGKYRHLIETVRGVGYRMAANGTGS